MVLIIVPSIYTALDDFGFVSDKKEKEDTTAAAAGAASQLLRASGGSTGIFKKNLNRILSVLDTIVGYVMFIQHYFL